MKNRSTLRHLLFGVAILLTGCTRISPGVVTPASGTVSAGTAVVSTSVPSYSTSQPPDFTPPPTPTPIPTLPGNPGLTELKYRLLGEFPDFFYCDPDFYPVARGDEMDLARQRFPELQANQEEFQAILTQNGLAGLTTFTGEQILLIYREHKKLAAILFEPAGSSYRFQIQVAKTEGSEGQVITGLIDGQGTITVQQNTPGIATCPICLAVGTLIDSPGGPIPVQDLRVGMVVWSLNRAGERVEQPILDSSKTIVPDGHRVVHLLLDDGRELLVSPGHPLAEGTASAATIGRLQEGDRLDGALVLSVERVPYSGHFTYDLLPQGETGFYWSNGILLASTLGSHP